MTTFSLRAKIDVDGKLKIELPLGLPAGDAEVLVVVQPSPAPAPDVSTSKPVATRSGLFVNIPGGDLDVDAELAEMRRRWKSKLAGA